MTTIITTTMGIIMGLPGMIMGTRTIIPIRTPIPMR